MKASIVIPCYEMYGKGSIFLSQLLQTISKQTVIDQIEIVVSDDSKNDSIKKICDEYSELNLKYIKNNSVIKNLAINCNNAIRHSTSNYIKPMLQDDFFVRTDAMERFIDNREGWCASGCVHYVDNIKQFTTSIIPYYQKDIIRGINTIGAPSSIAFIKGDNLFFDEKLIYQVDCELFYRLDMRSKLKVIPEILIGNRLWDGQVTNTQITDQIVKDEYKHINAKYNQTIFV
jgi:hypothetical protein